VTSTGMGKWEEKEQYPPCPRLKGVKSRRLGGVDKVNFGGPRWEGEGQQKRGRSQTASTDWQLNGEQGKKKKTRGKNTERSKVP